MVKKYYFYGTTTEATPPLSILWGGGGKNQLWIYWAVKSVGNMPSGSTKNVPFQVYFGLELGVRTWPERQQKKRAFQDILAEILESILI